MSNQQINPYDWSYLKSLMSIERSVLDVPLRLSRYIRSIEYELFDHPEASSFYYQPIPNDCVLMYLHFCSPIMLIGGSRFRTSKNAFSQYIVGMHKMHSMPFIKLLGKTERFVVRFEIGGFYKLFNLSAAEVKNKIEDVRVLLTPDLLAKALQVKYGETIEERYQLLLNLFSKMFEESRVEVKNSPDSIAEKIISNEGGVNIRSLLKEQNKSARTVQRSFLMNIGTTSKEFVRIVRFRSAISRISKNDYNNWQDLVFELGYYDQAHLINDFKAILGCTPNDFAKNIWKDNSTYVKELGVFKYMPY